MTKPLVNRTLDRLHKQMDDMVANIGNEQWWIEYHGGQEAHDELMALAQKAVDRMDERKNMSPEEIRKWAKQSASFISGGPNDDVEQWGRNIAIAADEETLRQEWLAEGWKNCVLELPEVPGEYEITIGKVFTSSTLWWKFDGNNWEERERLGHELEDCYWRDPSVEKNI